MDIVSKLEELRRQEHECTVAIVAALLECQRTKAYLELGYSTLWAFLVEHLHYSNAAASRRYKAMKCAQKFPVVLEMLRDHRVSLSSLAMVEALLGECEDPQALLDGIDGKSQPEVERVVAAARPVAKQRERVDRKFVRASAPPVEKLGEDQFSPAPAGHGGKSSAAEERVCVKLSLCTEAYAEFERARAIVSRQAGPAPSLEACLQELVAFYLSKKAPRHRAAPAGKEARRASRRIPVAVRDEVFLRDSQRCSFVAADGRRCAATHNLQIDHIQPLALGGSSGSDNLRLLCAAHNRRRAEKTFGVLALKPK